MKHHNHLTTLLNSLNIAFKLLKHAPCCTSEESSQARASQGEHAAVGAKALLIKRNEDRKYYLLVIPGLMKIDNKKARNEIGKFRFATSDELFQITSGLVPGSVPPVILPGMQIEGVFLDAEINSYSEIGFNAATLDHSIVMQTKDLARIPQKSRDVAISLYASN